jgi:imidazolonepropionase-like amidohydrolase
MHGNNLRELFYLGQAGMPANEVLLTATRNGAELMGLADRYGRLATGYVFDAIAFERDPSDLSIFERPDPVAMLFQSGQPRRAHARLQQSGLTKEEPVAA